MTEITFEKMSSEYKEKHKQWELVCIYIYVVTVETISTKLVMAIKQAYACTIHIYYRSMCCLPL